MIESLTHHVEVDFATHVIEDFFTAFRAANRIEAIFFGCVEGILFEFGLHGETV